MDRAVLALSRRAIDGPRAVDLMIIFNSEYFLSYNGRPIGALLR